MAGKDDFAGKFMDWYKKNKRELPWRQTTDPYRIWLSEVILQQTRIEQGTAYYNRFTEEYPNVQKLANASEDNILKLWQGLGYYSRARNMHETAKVICDTYNEKFPNSFKQLIGLKGIGEYTAAAIASIAFNLPHATVDGNVYRVLARLFGILDPIDTSKGKKVFQKLATELMDESEPGTFNQALMEFGALQCKPQNPNCHDCPFMSKCYAHNNNTIKKLPVKKGKTKVTDRYFNYIIIKHNESTFLHKQTENGIWKNLYQFPLIETSSSIPIEELSTDINDVCGDSTITFEGKSEWKRHLLSHQRIHYRFISLRVDEGKNIASDLIKVNKKDIFKFAVPKLIEREININNWFSPTHD